jgi:hypothetical protein
VNEGGGSPVAVTKAKKDWTHRNPYFLPDGKTFLYTGRNHYSMAVASLYTGSIDGSVERLVVENASNAVYEDGWIVFARDRNLIALCFDPRKGTTSGTPIPIAENLDYHNPRDLAKFSAANSMLAYTTAPSPRRDRWMFNRGRETAST